MTKPMHGQLALEGETPDYILQQVTCEVLETGQISATCLASLGMIGKRPQTWEQVIGLDGKVADQQLLADVQNRIPGTRGTTWTRSGRRLLSGATLD